MSIQPQRKQPITGKPICWRAHFDIPRARGNLFIRGGNLRASQESKWKSCEKAFTFQGLCCETLNSSLVWQFWWTLVRRLCQSQFAHFSQVEIRGNIMNLTWICLSFWHLDRVTNLGILFHFVHLFIFFFVFLSGESWNDQRYFV